MEFRSITLCDGKHVLLPKFRTDFLKRQCEDAAARVKHPKMSELVARMFQNYDVTFTIPAEKYASLDKDIVYHVSDNTEQAVEIQTAARGTGGGRGRSKSPTHRGGQPVARRTRSADNNNVGQGGRDETRSRANPNQVSAYEFAAVMSHFYIESEDMRNTKADRDKVVAWVDELFLRPDKVTIMNNAIAWLDKEGGIEKPTKFHKYFKDRQLGQLPFKEAEYIARLQTTPEYQGEDGEDRARAKFTESCCLFKTVREEAAKLFHDCNARQSVWTRLGEASLGKLTKDAGGYVVGSVWKGASVLVPSNYSTAAVVTSILLVVLFLAKYYEKAPAQDVNAVYGAVLTMFDEMAAFAVAIRIPIQNLRDNHVAEAVWRIEEATSVPPFEELNETINFHGDTVTALRLRIRISEQLANENAGNILTYPTTDEEKAQYRKETKEMVARSKNDTSRELGREVVSAHKRDLSRWGGPGELKPLKVEDQVLLHELRTNENDHVRRQEMYLAMRDRNMTSAELAMLTIRYYLEVSSGRGAAQNQDFATFKPLLEDVEVRNLITGDCPRDASTTNPTQQALHILACKLNGDATSSLHYLYGFIMALKDSDNISPEFMSAVLAETLFGFLQFSALIGNVWGDWQGNKRTISLPSAAKMMNYAIRGVLLFSNWAIIVQNMELVGAAHYSKFGESATDQLGGVDHRILFARNMFLGNVATVFGVRALPADDKTVDELGVVICGASTLFWGMGMHSAESSPLRPLQSFTPTAVVGFITSVYYGISGEGGVQTQIRNEFLFWAISLALTMVKGYSLASVGWLPRKPVAPPRAPTLHDRRYDRLA